MNKRQIVIVVYKPKPGKEAELLRLTREHVPLLRAEGLATDRAAVVGRASDGSILEVFEWEAGGAEAAHSNPRVLALWGRYSVASEFAPLQTLEEAGQMFASFASVEL